MIHPVSRNRIRKLAAGALLLSGLASSHFLPAQEPADAHDGQGVSARLDRMQHELDATQRQLEEYRAAMQSMQRQMKAMASANNQSCGSNALPDTPLAQDRNAVSLQQAVDDLREQQSVQQSEIAVHEQAKVETRSRYNLKIGGMVLFNAFENSGAVDSIDVPVIAEARKTGASNASMGASVRQSVITLDSTGPQFWGAHTYADVQVDFFGGLSTSDYTSTAGTARMRAASLQTVWPTVNVHAGLERLLVASSAPTSYATVGEPAMAWSGNLWAWVPQLAVEKALNTSDSSQFTLAAALADIPDPGPGSGNYVRTASAAESSRHPAVETRTAWSWGPNNSSAIGIGSYWSPHNYGASGNIHAWAALLDWRLMLPARFSFTGQAYKGQALGGLGGGAFKDVSISYYYPAGYGQLISKATALRDEGGWAQLKFRLNDLFELNAAFGQDNDSAAQLRANYISLSNPYSGLARNQTFLGNAIFRPRASLLLSFEYRRLASWQLVSPANTANIFGLAAGYEF